ncbi:MAG TPA: OB-fold domain-containing protein [Caulobacteraceae bacterium]|nr:OB-fold domain-containing protein [Caulobacteraceae bacterium]
MSDKPVPFATPRSEPFWEALKAHRVDIQQCADCHSWVFFPRLHCPHCFSHRLEWKTVSGEGELLTYTLSRVPTLPELADEVPQKLAVIRLDEGPHLNTTLVGLGEDEIKVGMRVKPVFDDVEPGEATLLRYTKA